MKLTCCALMTALLCFFPLIIAASMQQSATVGGTVKSVSSDGKQLTVSIGSGGSAREERFGVGARTKVSLDDKAARADEIEPGTKVTITYDKSSKQAASIKAVSAKGDSTKPDPSKSTKSDPAKPSGTKKDTPKDDSPGAQADDAIKTVAPKSPWTTKLAQMKIPDGRASGTILGQQFVLEDAKLDNGILTLRQGKEFFADAEIKVFLFLKEGENVEGKKFRIEAREGFGVPHIHASTRPKGDLAAGKTEQFLNKYAMILEFGKTARGRLPGKIYVCLPDQAKSVVAGHFSVEVFDSTHPLATEDSISGKFTVRGSAKNLEFTLGCLGKNEEGKFEGPGAGFKLGGGTTWAKSTTWAPRITTVSWDEKAGVSSHKHPNRPTGSLLGLRPRQPANHPGRPRNLRRVLRLEVGRVEGRQVEGRGRSRD